MSTTVRTVLLVTVIPLLAAAAAITALLVSAPQLPDELAAHWGPSGVDRVDGLGSFIALIAVLVPLMTATMVVGAVIAIRRGTTRAYLRQLVGLSVGFAVLISGGMATSALLQRGVSDVRTLGVEIALLPLLGAAVLGAVLALAAAALVPPVPVLEREVPVAAPLELAVGEKAVWAASVMSPRGVIALVAGLAIALPVLYIVVGLPLWAPIAIFALLAAGSSLLGFHVVIDDRGLRATGLYGYPRIHIPLERVESAAAVEVNAVRQFGGWGIRFDRLGRRGLIVRSGSAIEIARRDQPPYVVTVPDAATGAALLTALAARQRVQ